MNPLIIAGAALVGGVAYAGYKANLVEDMVLFSRSMVPNRRGLTAEQLEAGIRDPATRAQTVSYIGSELQGWISSQQDVANPGGVSVWKAGQSMLRGSIPQIVGSSIPNANGVSVPFYQIRSRWEEAPLGSVPEPTTFREREPITSERVNASFDRLRRTQRIPRR